MAHRPAQRRSHHQADAGGSEHANRIDDQYGQIQRSRLAAPRQIQIRRQGEHHQCQRGHVEVVRAPLGRGASPDGRQQAQDETGAGSQEQCVREAANGCALRDPLQIEKHLTDRGDREAPGEPTARHHVVFPRPANPHPRQRGCHGVGNGPVQIIEVVSRAQVAAEPCRHEEPDHDYQRAGDQLGGDPAMPGFRCAEVQS